MKFSLQLLCSTIPAAAAAFLGEPADLSTDLSNGAVLGVELTTPFPSSKYTLGVNETTWDIPVRGRAHVGKGVPDVSYIYIIDSSGSTSSPDGACGSTLECVQQFFVALHEEVIDNGSAKSVAVIDFDDNAHMTAEFQDPSNQGIIDAINAGYSSGGTLCEYALELAALAVLDPKNEANTTVVVFAGDGLCNINDDYDYYNYDQETQGENVTISADILAATGAIVHSIAVGDSVDCVEGNDLARIPRNGGECFSIPDPNDLPDIIDDIIGTNLTSLELKINDGNYVAVDNAEITKPLPAEGAVDVEFHTSANGLVEGAHTICVRATGSDSLGDVKQVEDCRDVLVEAVEREESQEDSPEISAGDLEDALAADLTGDASDVRKLGGQQIFIIVGSILVILVVAVVATRSFCTGKEEPSPADITIEEVDAKEVGDYKAPGAKREIV